jgi:hypothetical protein
MTEAHTVPLALSQATGEELWQMAGLASAMSSAPNIALIHRILTQAASRDDSLEDVAHGAIGEVSAKYLENATHYALAMADYMMAHAKARIDAARRDYDNAHDDYQRRRHLDQAIAEIALQTQLSETLVRLLLLALFRKDAPVKTRRSPTNFRRVAIQ